MTASTHRFVALALTTAAALLVGLAGANQARAGCGLLGLSPCAPSPQQADPHAAPDPGGQEHGYVPIPAPGKYFGFNEGAYMIPGRATAAEVARVARGAGANAARLNLDWRYLERTRDHWDEGTWAVYAEMYGELRARGMKPLLTIGAAPRWARDPGAQNCFHHTNCEYPPARHMLDEWAEFAVEVTRRFPAAAISVWNEPNLYQSWVNPSPERWAALVASAHDAIKAVNPGARVIAGGLSLNQNTTPSASGTSLPLKQFLTRAYEAPVSIRGNMDALGLNANTNKPEYGANSLFAKGISDIRTVRAQFGDGGRPIWLTESWLSTTGAQGISEAAQADGLLRLYKRAMTMPDVQALFVHTLLDRPEAPGTSWDRGVGMTYLDASRRLVAKSSYCAFSGRASLAPLLGCSAVYYPPPVSNGPQVPGDPGAGQGDNGGQDKTARACARAMHLSPRIKRLRAKARRARAARDWGRNRRLERRLGKARGKQRVAWRRCRAGSAA